MPGLRGDRKLHSETGKPIRSFVRDDVGESRTKGMEVQKAWRLARERFPDNKDAQVEEYRRLIRGAT
jgi:hypothetical protein